MKKLPEIEKVPNQLFKVQPNPDGWCNDDLLQTRMSMGDEAAFQVFYDKYWEQLYNLACSKLPSEIEAQYIIENLFRKIWHGRDFLHPARNAESFLLEELKKKIISYYGQTFFK